MMVKNNDEKLNVGRGFCDAQLAEAARRTTELDDCLREDMVKAEARHGASNRDKTWVSC